MSSGWWPKPQYLHSKVRKEEHKQGYRNETEEGYAEMGSLKQTRQYSTVFCIAVHFPPLCVWYTQFIQKCFTLMQLVINVSAEFLDQVGTKKKKQVQGPVTVCITVHCFSGWV